MANPLNAALAIRQSRARDTDAYRAIEAHAIQAVAAIARTGNLDEIKSRGGWSKIIADSVADMDATYEGPFGSRGTLVGLLDIGDIRVKGLLLAKKQA